MFRDDRKRIIFAMGMPCLFSINSDSPPLAGTKLGGSCLIACPYSCRRRRYRHQQASRACSSVFAPRDAFLTVSPPCAIPGHFFVIVQQSVKDPDMPLIGGFMPDGQDRPLDIFHPVGQHRRREVPVVLAGFRHMLKESLFLARFSGWGTGILNRPHQRVDARAEIS